VETKSLTLFDHLNNLTKDKVEVDFNNDEVKKSYNKYIINRFISFCELFIPVVNEINRYDVPNEVHYNYYLSILPKKKYYFNYIKKAKELNDDEKKYIAHYFSVGKKEADQYINILDEDQIQEILKIYEVGKNKMMEI
jgi:hypothetical protein